MELNIVIEITHRHNNIIMSMKLRVWYYGGIGITGKSIGRTDKIFDNTDKRSNIKFYLC